MVSAYDWKTEELDELSYLTQKVLDYQPKESNIFLKYEGISVFERKIYNEPVALLDSEL